MSLMTTSNRDDAAEEFTHARLGAVLVCRDPDDDGVETPGLSAADWSDDGPRERDAAIACLSCPVVDQCGAYALAAREPLGVWGAMTASERRKLLRAQGVRL